MLMLLILLQICLLIISAAVLWYYFQAIRSAVSGAPYISSPHISVSAMIGLAELQPGAVVYDLGSGDGRLIIAAAHTGARAIGIELNSAAALLARWRIRRAHITGATIIHGSFWHHSIKDADVVFVYLLPGLLGRLTKKLQGELSPGARVISKGWPIQGWVATQQSGDLYRYDIGHHLARRQKKD